MDVHASQVMTDIAHDLSDVRVAVARIEEQLKGLGREDVEGRLEQVERDIAWAKAWSAGAFAAVLAVFGVLSWVVAKMPAAINLAR